jgi:hypothetical protein
MLNRMSQIISPSGHFLLMFGLPRPKPLGDPKEPLRVSEMIRLLRPAVVMDDAAD